MALKPDHVPIARPRSSGENEVLIKREAIGDEQRRAHALQAARCDQLHNIAGDPQATDAAVNRSTPARKTFLRL